MRSTLQFALYIPSFSTHESLSLNFRSSSGAPTELIRSSSGALSVIFYLYCVLRSGASLLAYKNIRGLYGSEKVKALVHTRMIVYLVNLPILKSKLKQLRVSRCTYNLSPTNAHRNFYNCENVAAMC